MTKHMVRFYCEPPKGNVETAIDAWISNYNEWEGDPSTHTLVEVNTEMDGTGTDMLSGNYRFDQSDDKTNLLDDLETRLQANTSWYRIGYHVCDHDEANPTGCSWEDTREYGTVPSDVPTF